MSLCGTYQGICSKTCSNSFEHQWLKYVPCMSSPWARQLPFWSIHLCPLAKGLSQLGSLTVPFPHGRLGRLIWLPTTYLQLCLNCMWSWGATRVPQGKPWKGLHLCSYGKSIITDGSKHFGTAFVVEEHPHPIGEPSLISLSPVNSLVSQSELW